MSEARVIKKYPNRRLYDTEESRYITLDELTEKVRKGTDVTIVDAKSGQDLTQATLTQIILETPAARSLPVPLLRQLIRMQDDALGEGECGSREEHGRVRGRADGRLYPAARASSRRGAEGVTRG